MLNRFFILIGTIVLSTISFFKNISFKDKSLKKESDNDTVTSIFSRLDFEKKQTTKDEDRIDKLREFLIPIMLKKTSIKIMIALCIILLIVLPLEISGMFLTILCMVYIFLIYYPKIKQQKSYSDLNQELPYALRHMGIELKSGKGLHDTLITIRDANYGTLSKEIKRVLEEIKFGKSTEDALLEMSERINSEGLQRAIQQIIGTLRVGGNLANSLDIIAKDISFEMQIKLKEYAQRLNSFILIYTFIAILAPVITLIMLMAGSTVMGDVISSGLLLIIYSLFFPMIVMFMGVFIKRLEPKV
ncbi:MAG: type II secretion system F family protein [Methanobrevibacter sp.]|uniref:type II secretion system F family protein n=1 Tax=Methanobrevibacter sp. TaxID=66852 RepID=UPI0025CCAE26|nr:type II secretion system F family protein [Methanobrevibacter sp.]MBQ6099128.1 type II secretion system F family protein [Methanobrevibacter sp.]